MAKRKKRTVSRTSRVASKPKVKAVYAGKIVSNRKSSSSGRMSSTRSSGGCSTGNCG